MSLRRVDARFLLPRLPRRAVVLGLDEWRDGLRMAGAEIVQPEGRPDLAVAPAERARDAAATGAPHVLLEGRGGVAALRRRGLTARGYVPLPRLERVDLVLPLGWRSPARYALRHWRPAWTAVDAVRNAIAARLVGGGTLPLKEPQAVGSREPAPPALVAAAGELGVPSRSQWFLTLGQGDDLTRGVFHLFPPGGMEPAWVLKFSRVAGYEESFRRDEAGLGLAAAAGSVTAARAPRLLGRLTVGANHASVETAAVGEQLSTALRRHPSQARAAVDEIAAWVLALGHETAEHAGALAAERERLVREVVAAWDVDARLVTGLPGLPAVLQHNDLGSWNIVWAGRGGFTVVDWESARSGALPLWDLLYFLVDALPQLDGARSADERADAAIRLLRGEAPSSPVLFSWIRRAVADTSVPPEAVGQIATLCWLHHGLSHSARREARDRVAAGGDAIMPPVERIAPVWLADPALGETWDRWRA